MGTVVANVANAPSGVVTATSTGGMGASNAILSTNPIRLRKWQKALANVKAGLGNATIACVGDSTTAGQYANTAAWAGNKPLSYPTALAAAITAFSGTTAGIGSVTSDNSAIGHGGTTPSYDTRVALGASWTGASGLNIPGGQTINTVTSALGSAAAETLTFTPSGSFDTVVVTWFRNVAIGTFTVDCGGAVLATCAAGAKSVQRTTVTKAAGAGLVNIIRTVAPGVYVMGIETYLSTTKQVSVLNFGWSGGRMQASNGWGETTDVYFPAVALTQYAPDLSIINLGLNDAIAGNTQAVMVAGLTNLVTNALLTGDVLLVIPPYPDTTVASTAAMNTAAGAIYQVAATFGLPVLDLNARWGGYATSPTYFHTDKLHPIQLGYQDMALAINSVLLAN